MSAFKMMRKGCEAYLAHAVDTNNSPTKLEDIPIVREFPDVFPNELPGMPPDRDIEFTIDTIPGTIPISIPPYRMAPVELKELKKQLIELLEKGFYPSKCFTMGSTSIICQKEGWNYEIMYRLSKIKSSHRYEQISITKNRRLI